MQRLPWLLRVALPALVTVLCAAPAAAINQAHGGPQIPVGSDLQNRFTARGESIRVRDDAAVMPERFVPGCTLTFTLVTRGSASFRNVFGWYNVRPGVTPSPSNAPTDLHVLIPCDATDGQHFTLNLRGNPAYAGGEIGFFLRTPEDGVGSCSGDCCAGLSRAGHSFFSERAYNPDSTGADSYIHLLIYDSRVTPWSFYFAWEDLYSGGDNNFTDFIAQVDQIACTGGGGTCDTGAQGACAAGTMQCRAGALACTPSVAASAERCDGVDNDCNGTVDDGTGLCGAMQVCDRGRCVDRCLSELGCFPGFRCTDRGTCVEAGCDTVTCGANQRCVAGACVGACDGITCPAGQACRAGRCVDPCAGVSCDSDQACVAGVCVPRCECQACAAGRACGSDGRCVESSCATVTCSGGMVCAAGTCVDRCAGAHCPDGERCSMGICDAIPVPDGGIPRDVPSLGDVGFFSTDLGTPVVDAGPADAAMDAGTVFLVEPSGDCGCRAGGAGSRRGTGALASVLVALVALRRQRLVPKRSRSLRP